MSVSPGAWNGLLLVNKPSGMISKDVSRWLQRRLGRLRLGHVGTLDPMAEGVLPILLGNATRLQDFLLTSRKAYRFEIRFGFQTDSGDLDGQVLARSELTVPSQEAILAACHSLLGSPELLVPLMSAVKLRGKPLYAYAREGKADQVDEACLRRPMRVDALTLEAITDNSAVFSMVCGRGVYVRSVAAALCESLGVLGTVVSLIRTETAGFSLAETHRLEDIEAQLGNFSRLLIPTRDIRLPMARWCADQTMASRLRQGQRLSLAREEFLENLQNTKEIDRQEGYDSLLLLDDEREILGIGSASYRNTDDRMIISMRRALS